MASGRSRLIIVYSKPVGVERGVFKIIVSHVRTTHLKVSHNFNTSWLQANSDANSTRTAPSASPWVLKECGNLWSPPTILAVSTRTSSCLSGSPTDVIVPGTARLAFTITLASEDANRTVVQNLVRAIVKKLTIKISGNEVMSIDDSDVFH